MLRRSFARYYAAEPVPAARTSPPGRYRAGKRSQYEQRVTDHITTEQPLGFTEQPEYPLATQASHPLRSATHLAAEKVQDRPATHDQAGHAAGRQPGGNDFLLGHAHAQHHQFRLMLPGKFEVGLHIVE